MSLIWFIERTPFSDFSKEHKSKFIFKARLGKYSCTTFYNILYIISLTENFFVFVNFLCCELLLPTCPHVLRHSHPTNFVAISYVGLLLKSCRQMLGLF